MDLHFTLSKSQVVVLSFYIAYWIIAWEIFNEIPEIPKGKHEYEFSNFLRFSLVFQIVLRFIYKRIVRLLERRSVVVLIRIDVSKIDELSFPEFIFSTIYDFTVSVTILFGGANSGQISIKSRDRADKYLFPNLFSGSNFYIYQFPEGLGMRKIAHGIRMQNNSQTRTNIFWIFTEFHGVMWIQRS